MPKLVAVYAKQDEIPEALRELYAEVDGKWVVDLDIEADPRVHGLKTALTTERTEARMARGELAKFKALGATPDELADLKKLAQAAKDGKPGAQEQLDSLKAQLKVEHEKIVKAKDDEILELNGALFETLAENAARSALTEEEASVDLLLPHILKQVKIEKGADGKRRAIVVDEKGQALIADAAGTPMTPKHLVAKMKDDPKYAPAFPGVKSSGSGTPPTRRGAGSAADQNLSPEARLSRALEGSTPTRK